MHKPLVMGAICTLLNILPAGAQTTQWIRQFGTSGLDQALAVSDDGLGGIYVTGITKGPVFPFPASGFLTKFDDSGALLWSHQFGDADLDAGTGISADKVGNVFVVGQSPNYIGGNSETDFNGVNLNKYDASGNLIWAHQYGQPAEARRVLADGFGNAYVAGGAADPLFGPQTGAFLLKIDSAGNLLWGAQNAPSSNTQGLSLDGLGNAYISGVTSGRVRPTPDILMRLYKSTVPPEV